MEAGASATTIIRTQIWCCPPRAYKRQIADALLGMKSTGTNQKPIEDEIPVFMHHRLHPPEKGEGVGLPAVNAVETLTETGHDKRPITAHDSIHKQAKDSYCFQASSTVGLLGSTFNYDGNEFLVRTAPIKGAVRTVVPTSLQPRLLNHSHNPTLAGHQGERHLYESMRQEDYWPHLAIEVHQIVRDYREWARKSRQISDDAPYNYFPQVGNWNLLLWTYWDHFWRR